MTMYTKFTVILIPTDRFANVKCEIFQIRAEVVEWAQYTKYSIDRSNCVRWFVVNGVTAEYLKHIINRISVAFVI